MELLEKMMLVFISGSMKHFEEKKLMKYYNASFFSSFKKVKT
jgi:hypothetical protein